MLEKGLVQVYTGDAKGKTTAALGQSLRAVGSELKVAIFQFLKPASLATGERKAIERYGLPISMIPLDVEWDMSKSFDDPAAVAEAKERIESFCRRILEFAEQKRYDIIILDEINFCLAKGLARLESVKDIINNRDCGVEIILTGRDAPDEIIELADLVTEMKEIKHPFERGVRARKGIEF